MIEHARGSSIRLRDLLPEARHSGAADIPIAGCSSDSRNCQPGDVFVALSGENFDGHDFVLNAVQRGAVAVVCERPVPELPVPQCIVKDSRAALGLICQALAGEPSRQLKVVGITGTNGKTTTSRLIGSVLAAGGYPNGIIGTLGYDDGLLYERATHTTPPAPALAHWLQRMVGNGCTHAVMEVSSHSLVQSRVAGIELDTAVVTNVRHDHLDFHGTPEQYVAAKGRIFEHLTPQGVAVLNADDPGCEGYLLRIDNPALTVGIDRPAEIMATIVEQTASDQTFLLTAGSQSMPVRTTLIGRHNIYNCLAAAAVGLGYGLDMFSVVRGLEAVETVPGRLEAVQCGQPFRVLVDYAHTPDGLAEVLRTLRTTTPGRLIVVFGAGGNRDRFKRPQMARAAERFADLCVVTTDNPRYEEPQEIIDQIMVGFRRRGAVRSILDRGAAIRYALTQAREGDCVLLAGKGHEDYQEIDGRRFAFDDRAVAREFLYLSGGELRLFRAAA